MCDAYQYIEFHLGLEEQRKVSLCHLSGRESLFTFRLKLELSLSKEIAFAVLKTFYQGVAEGYMKSVWNGHQRT